MEGLIAKPGKLTLSFLTNLSLTVDLMVEIKPLVFVERNVKRVPYFLLKFFMSRNFFRNCVIVRYDFS